MRIINTNSKVANVSLAGGKGFSLFKLSKNGFNVPEFFIITTTCFEEFLKNNNLKEVIGKLYKKNNFQEVEKLIMNAEFSPDQVSEIEKSLKALKATKFSVRSSCTFEDSAQKSCAGQLKTFLNVTKENILKSIKKCFSSFYSQNLKDYVMGKENGSMAVVVQKMVDSEYSGVCFSTDFVNQDKDFCIVEATRGLGESLVSGKVTPTKYIIRKNNNFIEKKIGKIRDLEKIIENVALQASQIEKLYGVPMDIEWGYAKSKLYILQARPIVGKMDIVMDYNFVMSRPRPLFLMQIVQAQSYQGLRWFLDDQYYFRPVHLFTNGHFEEYSNMYKIEEDPQSMLQYLSTKCKDVEKKLETAYECARKVEYMTTGKARFDIDEFIDCFVKFGANNTLANLVENTTNISKISYRLDSTLKRKVIKHREYFDKVKYDADDFIIHYLKMTLDKKFQKYLNVMTLDEVFKGKSVSVKELERRLRGFAYYCDKIIYPEDYADFFKKHFMNLNLRSAEKVEGTECLSGSVAYSGKVHGRVKIVYSEEDLQKVTKGDIIVSTMTVPTYIGAMKIAGGIVTDEGGTVCHAALISRELKKPCIVGTGRATLVFKDNMLVELDANTGKIYLIKE